VSIDISWRRARTGIFYTILINAIHYIRIKHIKIFDWIF